MEPVRSHTQGVGQEGRAQTGNRTHNLLTRWLAVDTDGKSGGWVMGGAYRGLLQAVKQVVALLLHVGIGLTHQRLACLLGRLQGKGQVT